MNLLKAVEFGAVAISLYELAHIGVAHALKVKIHQVGIGWRGVYVRRERRDAELKTSPSHSPALA